MIDVISPCVTFNDHEGSTKSYAYAKEHDEPVGEVSFVPFFEDISVDYDPGTTTGSRRCTTARSCILKKVAEDYNPTDKLAAMRLLHETAQPRRVRDRHPLHRAGQGRFPHAAEPRGRAAGDAAARAWSAGPRSARRGHGRVTGDGGDDSGRMTDAERYDTMRHVTRILASVALACLRSSARARTESVR